MEVTHNLILHLTSPTVAVIDAVQGDGARLMACRLKANGGPWAVPEGVKAGLSYTLPDNTRGFYDELSGGTPAAAIDGSTIIMILDPALTEMPGTVEMSIVLRRGTQQVATFPVRLRVAAAPGTITADSLAPEAHGFQDKIYYGGPGGALIPLGLGEGVSVETLDDGSVWLVAQGGGASGDAGKAVAAHNVAVDAHQDIRNALEALRNRLNTALNSDDIDLDQLAEIVAYIKSNRTLIDAITTSKVSVSDIVDDLVTNVANRPLSAAQGVVLAGRIEELKKGGTGNGSGQNVALTATERSTLIAVVNAIGVFNVPNGQALIDAFNAAWTGTGGGVAPDEPEQPAKTLVSISAAYSGGDVAVGTAVADLTGIVVTAHYSDGSTDVVTGYTLSGTIAEGSNTITVTYQGKTATFTVTGVAESSIEDYQQVEYIEFDGNQRIVTDALGANQFDMEAVVSFQESTTERAIMVLSNGTNGLSEVAYKNKLFFYVSGYVYAPDGATQYDSVTKISAHYEHGVERSLTVEVGGETYTETGDTPRTFSEEKFTLGSTAYNSQKYAYVGKLYSASYSANGVLMCDLMPCYRKSDGVIGMYDKVTGNFYTNSGTGTFGKGADVA